MKKWAAIKKIIKPRNIIVLILLLAANTFAWFIYATKVDNSMTARVRGWNVLFESGDSPIVDNVAVDFAALYPGMEPSIYEIKAYNKSEVGAELSYTLLEADILGDHYVTVEGRGKNGETVQPGDLTSATFLAKLASDYPFKISITVTTVSMVAETGEAVYQIKVEWPYESGDDEADTLWGKKAAKYKEDYPTKSSITLVIEISITQAT